MQPKNVLVFRIGQLGDTIVALPAMWAVRKHFSDVKLTLLCDHHLGKHHVLAADLLRGAGLFNAFESYVVDTSAPSKVTKLFQMFELLWRLRHGHFDTLVYLAPSTRTPEQVKRDRKFFSASGIKNFIGMRAFVELPKKRTGLPLGTTLPEADLILARLAVDGIPVPTVGKGCLYLGLGRLEESEVSDWLTKMPSDGGRTWIGIGPGTKMPAKRWPEERFREVVAALINRFDIWPVVFGGPEDAALAGQLIAAWERGYNAAGSLSLRGAAAALRRCAIYLGNDTGTMHLAAAADVPCVALFSAREWPGMWFPYGSEHRVFRADIQCEGCQLVECIERQNECLQRITTEQVLAGCEHKLTQKMLKAEF